MRNATAALLLALAPLAIAQQDAEPPPPDAAALLARFQRLERDQRNTVVRNMERRLARETDAMLLQIAAFERGLSSYPQSPAAAWYLPRDYAPVATERRLVAAGTPAHTTATRRMTPLVFLPDLNSCVAYDWRLGQAVRTADGLDDDRRFANYVNGYAPGADHAIARILEQLDTDPEQKKLAAFFDHLYADRVGNVFAGTTMFEAWNSGLVVEMPDTDAIAYARNILHTQSFVSPIPGDRRRDRLYQRVREGFAAHREYRSLRLAAAAAFVAADPQIDPTYEPLVRRCRWLWIQVGYDVGQFAVRLKESGDRTKFLSAIDRAIETSTEIVDGERDAMRTRAAYLRTLADRELKACGS